MHAIFRLVALSLALTLTACAITRTSQVGPGASANAPTYVPEAGRDAATVAEMRAAPAPSLPEIIAGRNAGGDRSRLSAQGFVSIGSARYAGEESPVRAAAMDQGRSVGADRVLLYPPSAAPSDAAAGVGHETWLATFYVRFRLLFGATFRDLKAAERATLGADGVQLGSILGDTPAARANLLAGDFVLSVDGRAVSGRVAFQDLLRQNTGRTVTLGLIRNGEPLQRPVRLGALPGGER